MREPPILRLSNELLNAILKEIEPATNHTIAVDDRRFLSVESFDTPPTDLPNSVADICNFRKLGKRFAQLGAAPLFTRVTARFSEKGLNRLAQLANWPHLACHVKKFSYLVPYFFRAGADNLDAIAYTLDSEAGIGPTKLIKLKQKAAEQQKLCATQTDVTILARAISTFSELQFVQLLRVTDDDDRAILSFLQRHSDAKSEVDLDWTTACLHASRTIGLALLTSSNTHWSRFSSPMLSPASTQFLQVARPESISILAERLTCLTLHFDDGENLDAKMRDLSECFRTVFSRARDMQVVHVGFPIHRPLTLALEDIFHHVRWDKLHAFGVQAWELHADEIVGFVRRHRSLKGLRLRDVNLREGSYWRDVLPVLRNELPRLEWVSLRRIGYLPNPILEITGAELPDYMFQAMLDSDSSDSDDDSSTADAAESVAQSTESDADSDVHSTSDVDDDNRMDFPGLDLSAPVMAPECACDDQDHSATGEDLGDIGERPDNATRKRWERWVLRRCPEHDP